MPQNILILLASEYPNGNGETFLANEMPYLAETFDSIVIITNSQKGTTRSVPDNATVKHFPYHLSFAEKLKAAWNYTDKNCREEIKFAKNKYGIKDKGILRKIVYTSYYKARKLSRFIKAISADYVEKDTLFTLYSYWMNDMALGCALAALQIPNARAICRAHGWDVYHERHTPPYLPFRRFLADNLHAIFFISEHGRNYFYKATGIKPSSHIKVSYLGTDFQEVPACKKEDGLLRIVSCSSLIPLKQLGLLAEAIHLLPAPLNVHWTHLGSGPGLEKLRLQCEELFKDNTRIQYDLKGQMNNENIIRFYAENPQDVFVNVSSTEGLPVSIMEAFCFGIPAIAPAIGGIPEIVTDRSSGLLLPPLPDAAAIADKLLEFSRLDLPTLKSYREQARYTWEEKFDAEINFKNFCIVLNALHR